MAFVLSLLMALVLVSYGPGGSLGCDLSQNHVLVGSQNLRLLCEMKRISSHFCLQDRKDFAFPQEMVEGGQLQEAQAISVLHEMLQQSFNLFHTERSSAAWDTTLLKKLRTGLLGQLDDLDGYLEQVMGEEDSDLGRTGPTLAVKRYFQGIHDYLQEKEYSDCAWETVRVEIMRSLSSSASLQERLRMMDGDLSSPCMTLPDEDATSPFYTHLGSFQKTLNSALATKFIELTQPIHVSSNKQVDIKVITCRGINP